MSDGKKIFISHASDDAIIGEKLLDALIEIGISKNDVFYSSKYHTGVGLGQNFHQTVKENLLAAQTVIFILTKNFYNSPYCLNEMGAVWIQGKEILPILLDGLDYEDMQGFVDGHHIAFKPEVGKSFQLFSFLHKYSTGDNIEFDIEAVFSEFIKSANDMAKKTEKLSVKAVLDISNLEKMILQNKFTDDEILLFGYFLDRKSNTLGDYEEYNHRTSEFNDSKGLSDIKKYSALYGSFDYENAKYMLIQSGYIYRNYSESDEFEYIGCTFNIDEYRNLLSLSDITKKIIQNVRDKYAVANTPKPEEKKKNSLHNNEIEQWISGSKITETEALLYKYMIDTNTTVLGDRWKASEQVRQIEIWQQNNSLNNKLSRSYDAALRQILFHKYMDVKSTTSYGNPREHELKEKFKQQLFNLGKDAIDKLNSVISNNIKVDDALPF